MQTRDLGRFAEEAGGFLREEHGFSYAKRRFTRTDELIRSAWFMPLNATADRYLFDVVFDLGIPGVSAFGPKAQRHVVRAHAQLTSQSSPDYPTPTFVLRAGDDGRPVAPGVDEVVRQLTDDFLLRYPGPVALYEMVRDSGMIAARDGLTADTEFSRLRLDPFNVIKRLELAAVYAAYLGRDDEVRAILEAARQHATSHRVEYMIPIIEGGVAEAEQARVG
ncbi:MAG TPA: hypothetical protein VFH03_12140 [Actinoplanes sp.]|nr:hypothetical protein [Actinoplanes sp.]